MGKINMNEFERAQNWLLLYQPPTEDIASLKIDLEVLGILYLSATIANQDPVSDFHIELLQNSGLSYRYRKLGDLLDNQIQETEAESALKETTKFRDHRNKRGRASISSPVKLT